MMASCNMMASYDISRENIGDLAQEEQLQIQRIHMLAAD